MKDYLDLDQSIFGVEWICICDFESGKPHYVALVWVTLEVTPLGNNFIKAAAIKSLMRSVKENRPNFVESGLIKGVMIRQRNAIPDQSGGFITHSDIDNLFD